MCKIDLSQEALQKRREIAEKAFFSLWDMDDLEVVVDTNDPRITVHDPIYGVEIARCIADNSPETVIAMIDEIERLRSENQALERQLWWLIDEIREHARPHEFCPSSKGDGCEFTWYDGHNDRPDCRNCWREHARRGE